VDDQPVTLDFTLRPLDEIIQNGDFEDGLSDWFTAPGGVVDPAVVDTGVRSGGYSLALGLDSPTSGTCAVTQTLSIAPSTYLPTLSFWHRTSGVGGDDSFEVGIYHGDPWTYYPLSTLDTTEEWMHAWVDVSPYTGPAWICFSYHQEGAQDFVAYLDEVSLGRASGGTSKTYLPFYP
jgi:hypothetical protein